MLRSAAAVALLALLALAGCSKDTPVAAKDSKPPVTAKPAIDFSKITEWTEQQRAAFVETAREQSEALRVRGDALKTRAQTAARPAVDEAVAKLEEARTRYRGDLFRLSEQIREGTAEAFQETRRRVAESRYAVYEAIEKLERALDGD